MQIKEGPVCMCLLNLYTHVAYTYAHAYIYTCMYQNLHTWPHRCKYMHTQTHTSTALTLALTSWNKPPNPGIALLRCLPSVMATVCFSAGDHDFSSVPHSWHHVPTNVSDSHLSSLSSPLHILLGADYRTQESSALFLIVLHRNLSLVLPVKICEAARGKGNSK